MTAEGEERQPLLPCQSTHQSDDKETQSRVVRWRKAVANLLETPSVHLTIISLIGIDAVCVLIDLGYAFLTNTCVPADEGPYFLEILEHISEAITWLFLIEIPLSVFAFTWRFYFPFGGVHHAGLHLFDALVIVTTFVLEIVLRGRERELAALLVVLRLWRLVKLVAGVAIGSAELEEETSRKLAETEDELKRVEDKLSAALRTNEELKRRLSHFEDPESS
jgi:hypothetical protein